MIRGTHLTLQFMESLAIWERRRRNVKTQERTEELKTVVFEAWRAGESDK